MIVEVKNQGCAAEGSVPSMDKCGQNRKRQLRKGTFVTLTTELYDYRD